MNFAHSTLRSNELRLLRVGSTDIQSLYFQVLHVSRESAPPYTAVSYTWGDEKPTQWIYLNRQRFNVRLNLWSCLYYLSLASRHAEWDYMWVDAICIDQSNDSERNAQVRLMDETYRDAACVSVWLGLVPTAEQYTKFGPEPVQTFDDDGFDWLSSMKNIANRPYWSRFWVIQEFLLGHNVQLYCSGNCIDWQDFQDVLGYETGENFLTSESYGTIKNTSANSYTAVPLIMGRHVDRHPEFLQPLHKLLINHRNSQCKDPRDRVFALLGLVTRDERGLLNRFFPDYRMSEDGVVVITLGHVAHFSLGEFPPDSEQLFSALGIKSKVRKKRLLKHLERFDYLGLGSARWLQEEMDFWDSLEATQNEVLDQSEDADTSESSSTSVAGPIVAFLLLVLLLGAILWRKLW
jgi:hypothetical protein